MSGLAQFSLADLVLQPLLDHHAVPPTLSHTVLARIQPRLHSTFPSGKSYKYMRVPTEDTTLMQIDALGAACRCPSEEVKAFGCNALACFGLRTRREAPNLMLLPSRLLFLYHQGNLLYTRP